MVVVNPCNSLLLSDAGGPCGYDDINWIPSKVMCSYQAADPTVFTTIKYPHMMDWKAFPMSQYDQHDHQRDQQWDQIQNVQENQWE